MKKIFVWVLLVAVLSSLAPVALAQEPEVCSDSSCMTWTWADAWAQNLDVDRIPVGLHPGEKATISLVSTFATKQVGFAVTSEGGISLSQIGFANLSWELEGQRDGHWAMYANVISSGSGSFGWLSTGLFRLKEVIEFTPNKPGVYALKGLGEVTSISSALAGRLNDGSWCLSQAIAWDEIQKEWVITVLPWPTPSWKPVAEKVVIKGLNSPVAVEELGALDYQWIELKKLNLTDQGFVWEEIPPGHPADQGTSQTGRYELTLLCQEGEFLLGGNVRSSRSKCIYSAKPCNKDGKCLEPRVLLVENTGLDGTQTFNWFDQECTDQIIAFK
ncbi:hypothetical protein GYA49_04070 [Candidatus Beckwithbacteria bacterium]|nr:hypothetical protein [Candidatus Beckwithbacteria bacterium]